MYKTLSNIQKFSPSQSKIQYNSEVSSACSSSNMDHECQHGCHFNYDSEDGAVDNLVGQALKHCEATRGGKKRLFNNAQERIQFRQQYESKKKTELCRNFEMYGQCRYGDSCSYAHGSYQLQKKSHLPSNFMTKLCIQFHEEGTCAYGERCQYLHSNYDLKTELTYTQALKEGGRLTNIRNKQINSNTVGGADCLWANLKTSDGCGAPKMPRLPIFEQIYNKEIYDPELHDENFSQKQNFMKRTNSSSSMNYQTSSQDFTYQPKQQQPMNYNYNSNNNYNMGYQANYMQDNTQFQNYQANNQMYNQQYQQTQYYNNYNNCGQQSYEPQSPSYQVNQGFQQIWA